MVLKDRSEQIKTKEKEESEEKFLALNARENKWINKNSKFFKGKYKKCGKYGHRASDHWGDNNDKRNENKTSRNPRFNRECNNCGKRSHKAVDC